ncbi:MAG: DNA-protecting protein DprA [Phycisphaera sp.]|nr:DNA-protecting protein DprA [Phycisphaera sp.]
MTEPDPHYPSGWKGMVDPPVLMRCLGATGCLVERPVVAIVGARRCSAIGLDLAARFAAEFTDAGWAVCSGGARGIDAAAHRACLRAGGSTIAILGSGLARMYPPEHRGLFCEIVERGGLVASELRVEAVPRPSHFPVRNRLVAGLSVGVLLIEAGARSGALITGRLAAEDYGREVVAIPGRIDTKASAGCHRAIREGWAVLVDEPGQAIEQLESQAGLLRLQDAAKGGKE